MAKKYQIHGDFGSGSNKSPYIAQDTPPEDTSVLWVDPTDNSDDGVQEVVDKVIAQIKESGELDCDASGIAITGATVGQTVKISAVDENGVPTAWEPVDFPSGEWEQVFEIEITEPTEKIVFENLNADTMLFISVGLKTDKASSMGAYHSIYGTEGNLEGKLLYHSNVFNAITQQQGFVLIKEIGSGCKFSLAVNKPEMPLSISMSTTTSSPAFPADMKIGKINKYEVLPSEGNYPFTGGKVMLCVGRDK